MWLLFPLVLSLSSRQLFWVKTSLFEWKHCHIQPYFTQMMIFSPLFEQKRCHLMIFSWRLESERMRAWGKRNHKFQAVLASCRKLGTIVISKLMYQKMSITTPLQQFTKCNNFLMYGYVDSCEKNLSNFVPPA